MCESRRSEIAAILSQAMLRRKRCVAEYVTDDDDVSDRDAVSANDDAVSECDSDTEVTL